MLHFKIVGWRQWILAMAVAILPCLSPSVGAALIAFPSSTDSHGVTTYQAGSDYNGPSATVLRVLAPDSPSAGKVHRFIYVLPVIPGVDLGNEFGDGLEELRLLNAHNRFNAHIIAPSFTAVPWYGDSVTDASHRYESFMVNDLAPWVESNYGNGAGEQHLLLGFSKSGFGAMTLILRNPNTFSIAAAWDFPASLPDTSIFEMLDTYGTDENFQANYRLTSEFIAARAAPFQDHPRLWMSDDFATYFGQLTYRNDVLAFAGRLDAAGIPYAMQGTESRPHTWFSGWITNALVGLQSLGYTAKDGFARADGGLGSQWVQDPFWGGGLGIVNQRVTGNGFAGGGYLWQGSRFGPDQYSQIRLGGNVGDWVGVSVRGSELDSSSYVAAVKPDGAYLYLQHNGTVVELAHDAATLWSSGDVLKLTVHTLTTGGIRLGLFRNGQLLLAHDESVAVLTGGRPGFAAAAFAGLAIDDWEGGETTGNPPSLTPPTGSGGTVDDFNRADGGLGAAWTKDDFWGAGLAITGAKVTAPSGNGGGALRSAEVFGEDQFSQIRIAGVVGDWCGVGVRAKLSPAQGYWVAVKPDGAHLYAMTAGAFHELKVDGNSWASGDLVRLAVQTVSPGKARLVLYRNGTVVFAHDETSFFLSGGTAGIAMSAGSAGMALDDWSGGELGSGETLPSPPQPSGTDDFNRAAGGLGSAWTKDTFWGNGLNISGGQVVATAGNGGGAYRNLENFVENQFSEIRIAGVVGDWTGVGVRASLAPLQGYWVAVKPDGLHLYAMAAGVFHELKVDPGAWASGDVIKLAVQTVGASTARLAVYRNGVLIVVFDDAAFFLSGGQPGIALSAGSSGMALDDWAGGALGVGEDLPAPHASATADNFNRPDTSLGSGWTRDPFWGAGLSLAGEQVVAATGSGGGYYRAADHFVENQYSEVRIAGVVGDWTGVGVRASVSPLQGYWAAVKPDGTHLYSMAGGSFQELKVSGEAWASGDVVRLAVQTLSAGTARLVVYRNGNLVLSHDDSSFFIGDGQPGIALNAGTTGMALDDWAGGDLEPGVQLPAPHLTSNSDNFNRNDGGLGVAWTQDTFWGTGMSISGSQVVASSGSGGGYYRSAENFLENQYSEVRIAGAVGDWVGVGVRAALSPRQGYWAAVKPDGMHLYSLLNGVFGELRVDASGWASGDIVRLAVQTVAPATARLAVYRNGTLVFVFDDTTSFMTGGQPGIALSAGTTGMALDDWAGGELGVGEDLPAPHVSSAADDFQRADGGLAGGWVRDNFWGAGLSIASGKAVATPGAGGGYYWGAQSFQQDQYSEVRISGVVGDWIGVGVRATATPLQGYWAAVKPDGTHLYSLAGGVFHELKISGEVWATGDVLRLAVQTSSPGTARLVVYRNGTLLFAYDDSSFYLSGGQPGIALNAGASGMSLDDWVGGELDDGVSLPAPHLTSNTDNFNRADGGLGGAWTPDAFWGSGLSLSGAQVIGTTGSGGGAYRNAENFVGDQYSEVRIAGVVGDWVGVGVRAKVSPQQGYWVAVKPDGAHLYALAAGVFHELKVDSTVWATGDVVRLAVQTVGVGTVRLVVYRNGTVLMSHDEVSYLLSGGQPGIALNVGFSGMALDDWGGGELEPGEVLPPPTLMQSTDDFNRADGGLGTEWVGDSFWGTGLNLLGNQVSVATGSGGGAYRAIAGVAPDQYSQVRISGVVGDWIGVGVRASASPLQGYWAAVKADGTHLYGMSGGAFRELKVDASAWASGDVIKLAVQTVQAGTARLVVYRNGVVLFTHDDSQLFLRGGGPGIGMHASIPGMAIDDWEGGALSPEENLAAVVGPTAGQDNFDRADGALGVAWSQDFSWGGGGGIQANQLISEVGTGGAYYRVAESFADNQFSEVRLAGVIADWQGVCVRGGAAPRQGYWAAVKADGVHLYGMAGGVFHEFRSDAEPWQSGDLLRLAVQTVNPGVARLALYRNGNVVFSYDDALYFLAGGTPGVGFFATTAGMALDDWQGGGLASGEVLPTDATLTPGLDTFDRANGALGGAWLQDLFWGSDVSISGNQLVATVGNGGAYYRAAETSGADQFSQIVLSGVIGEWQGVCVRAKASPLQGYWAAVKPDGVHLYSMAGGVFHELKSNGGAWSTGDVLRLAVQEVGAGTSRLVVYRNDNVLISHDDSAFVLGGGMPGFGMYATVSGMALDTWEGGGLLPGEVLPGPTTAASLQDSFNRANGGPGVAWQQDPFWGFGAAINSGEVQALPGAGGAFYRIDQAFGEDQFSEVRLSGPVGDWAGVSVRAGMAPVLQGYWAAVKADGLYLYSMSQGAFVLLAHDPTGWSTGDRLRLTVTTSSPGVARLVVARNGSGLLDLQDSSHFLSGGQPGIGLHGVSSAISLDDWQGGDALAAP